MQNNDKQFLEQQNTIQQQQQDLERSNRELQQIKEQLEDLVKQRTRELNKSNKALKQEIQERIQIELALRDSESKFRSLLQSSPDGIVIVDAAGVIDLVSDQIEKLFGYSPQELVGQRVEILVPLMQRKVHEEHRAQYLKNPYCRFMGDNMQLYAQSKSGDSIPVEVSLSPVKTQQGMLIIAAIRDISKRKQVEDELMNHRNHLEELVADRTAELSAVNQELEQFSYTVSHDLRVPLRSIDGFSLVLMEDFAAQLPDEANGHLQRIRTAAQHMGQLIDEVLELARINRCDLKKTVVDLTKLANDINTDLRVNEPDRNISIHVGNGLWANADETLMRVVLENLIGNAWKFTSRKDVAEIIFDVKTVGEEKIFFVKDNGAGFNMQYADKLFAPFQRLHSDADFVGTGIGLSSVQRIIQRHGGRIWVESELNNGTIFYFTLGH